MSSLHRIVAIVVLATGLVLAPGARVEAQGYGGGPAAYFTGGGTGYVPYGASMGGFLPYNPAQGGLGIQPGMRPMGPPPAERSVMTGGMAPALGSVPTRLSPL